MKISKNFISIFLILFFVFSFFCFPVTTYAKELSYSDVLSDLQLDDNFLTSDFKEDDDNYSFEVIQVSESNLGEVYLYVFQPAYKTKPLFATKIRLSLGYGKDLDVNDYDLKLLSYKDGFQKYLIKNLNVSRNNLRTYFIVGILRNFNSLLDEAPSVGYISEVNFEVGVVFTAATINGNTVYSSFKEKVIVVTKKEYGNLYYSTGFKLFSYGACNSHVLGYSFNIPFDQLVSVRISFDSTRYRQNHFIGSSPYALGVKHLDVSYNFLDTFYIQDDVIIPIFYPLKERISTSSDFLSSESVDVSLYNRLKECDWVIRFYESSYDDINYTNNYTAGYNLFEVVSDVTMLELSYLENGLVYKMGVVDDLRTGTFYSEGGGGGDDSCVRLTTGTIILIIILVLLAWLLDRIGLLRYVTEGIIWLLKQPFRFFKWCFSKIKKNPKKTKSKNLSSKKIKYRISSKSKKRYRKKKR